MRRIAITLAVLVAAVGMTAASALAASIHFKQGTSPSAAISGAQNETLTVAGTLVGLGRQPGTITLDASGFVSSQCANPGTNGKVVEAHSGTTELASGSVSINPDSITKSGNYPFQVSATANPTSQCPNPNWTQSSTVVFTSYTLTVTQGSNSTTLGPFNVG